MRIAPVGIAVPVGDGLVDRVVEASLVTHGTGVALAGAAAVAAAVSAGIDGATVRETFDIAADAAAAGRRAGPLGGRGRRGRADPVGIGCPRRAGPVEAIGTLVGTSLATQESVPAAFAVLALAGDDPWLACRLGASVGGDCDTIAAMAGRDGGRVLRGGRAAGPGEHSRTSTSTGSPTASWRCGPARDHPAGVGWWAVSRCGPARDDRAGARASPGRRRGGVARDRRFRPIPHTGARRRPAPAITAVTGRLIGIGSVVVDVLATVPDLPPRGGDVWASRMRMAAGGGFHALAAAARRGVPVEYAGAHGTGPFGDLARAALQAEGIAVRLAPRPDADTGVVVVLVDGGGERTFVSGRGAETTLGPADLADLAPDRRATSCWCPATASTTRSPTGWRSCPTPSPWRSTPVRSSARVRSPGRGTAWTGSAPTPRKPPR